MISCALLSTSYYSVQHDTSHHSLHHKKVAKLLALSIVLPLSSLHRLSIQLLPTMLTLSDPQSLTWVSLHTPTTLKIRWDGIGFDAMAWNGMRLEHDGSVGWSIR